MLQTIRHISIQKVLSLLLLGATFLVAGFDMVDTQSVVGQEIAHEEADDQPTHIELTVSATLQSHFQLDLTFHSFLVETVEVSEDSEPPSDLTDQFFPSISKNFRILLRQIIATNAP